MKIFTILLMLIFTICCSGGGNDEPTVLNNGIPDSGSLIQETNIGSLSVSVDLTEIESGVRNKNLGRIYDVKKVYAEFWDGNYHGKVELVKVNTYLYEGFVTNLPLNKEITIFFRAENHSGEIIFEKSQILTLDGINQGSVAVGLEPLTDGQKNNEVVIERIEKSKSKPYVGETMSFTVIAHDKDDDSLSYSWTSSAGSFKSRELLSPTWLWVAPLTPQTVNISVTVSDGESSRTVKFNIVVRDINDKEESSLVSVVFAPQLTGFDGVWEGKNLTLSPNTVYTGYTYNYTWLVNGKEKSSESSYTVKANNNGEIVDEVVLRLGYDDYDISIEYPVDFADEVRPVVEVNKTPTLINVNPNNYDTLYIDQVTNTGIIDFIFDKKISKEIDLRDLLDNVYLELSTIYGYGYNTSGVIDGKLAKIVENPSQENEVSLDIVQTDIERDTIRLKFYNLFEGRSLLTNYSYSTHKFYFKLENNSFLKDTNAKLNYFVKESN